MAEHWTDRIVGDRMVVDQEFTDRIARSRFNRQEWGLIMTAVEFEITDPTDASDARLIADTSKLATVIPELDSIEELRMQRPTGSSGGPLGGILDNVRDTLGLGGSDGGLPGPFGSDDEVDQERVEAARQLANEYARDLQTHLEKEGKWEEVRATAADQ